MSFRDDQDAAALRLEDLERRLEARERELAAALADAKAARDAIAADAVTDAEREQQRREAEAVAEVHPRENVALRAGRDITPWLDRRAVAVLTSWAIATLALIAAGYVEVQREEERTASSVQLQRARLDLASCRETVGELRRAASGTETRSDLVRETLDHGGMLTLDAPSP